MLLVFRILILVALIRFLIATEMPFWCSGIYTGFVFLTGLMLGMPFASVLLGSLIVYGLASLYFWLLYRFDGGILWWVIMLGGMGIGIV